MKTAEDGKRVLVRPRVVDAGYANRKLLPGDVDEIEVGNRLVERYHSLWSALTDTDTGWFRETPAQCRRFHAGPG